MDRKQILAAVFTLSLRGGKASAGTIASQVGLDVARVRKEMDRLKRQGLLKAGKGGVELTPRGRKSIRVVFIGGGFEVIHHGHLYTIGKAKGLGDVLVVSVARDSTIRRRKKREPLANEELRVKLLSSLKEVDAAILGVEGDIYLTLEKVAPDIVALGYDQYHLEDEVMKEASKRGLKLRVIRLDSPYPEMKTSTLLKEF
jgi:cytidyltransferase-like protein